MSLNPLRFLALTCLLSGMATDTLADVNDLFWSLPQASLKHSARVNHGAFSRDNNWVITSSDDHTASVWHFPYLKTLAPGQKAISRVSVRHSGPVRLSVVSKNNKFLMTCSDDGTARLLRLSALTGNKKNSLVAVLRHDAAVTHCTFDRKANLILTVSADGLAKVWKVSELLRLPDSQQAKPIATLNPSSKIGFGGFSDDGTMVLTCGTIPASDSSSGSNEQGIFQLWDSSSLVQNQASVQVTVISTREVSRAVRQCLFTNENSHVLTVTGDSSAALWSIQQLRSQPDTRNSSADFQLRFGPNASHGVFSRDSRWLILSNKHHTSALWNVSELVNNTAPVSIGTYSHQSPILMSAISPDVNWVLTCTSGSVHLWEGPGATGNLPSNPVSVRQVNGVSFCAFSYDNTVFLTAGGNSATLSWINLVPLIRFNQQRLSGNREILFNP